MKRVSSLLLTHLRRPHKTPSFLSGCNSYSPLHSSNNSPISAPCTLEHQRSHFPNISGTFTFSRNFSIHSFNGSEVEDYKDQLWSDLTSPTKTMADKLKTFAVMDAIYEESELVEACLEMGIVLTVAKDHEKALYFANRALKFFDSGDPKLSDRLAMTLRLVGAAYEGLNRLNDGLECYNKALKLMDGVKDDDSPDFWIGVYIIRWGLYQINIKLKRREEAVVHLRKALEIKETKLAENPRDVAFLNMELAERYAEVKNFKEALPFGLKALDMHIELGSNAHFVALARTVLAMIYTGLGEHAKASEQNDLSGKFLRWDGSYNSLAAKVDAAKELVAERRHVEAMAILLVPVTSVHFINRPEAKNDLELQKKFKEARKLWMICAEG